MRHFCPGEVAPTLAISSLTSGVQAPCAELCTVDCARASHALTALDRSATRAEPLATITASAESQLIPTSMARGKAILVRTQEAPSADFWTWSPERDEADGLREFAGGSRRPRVAALGSSLISAARIYRGTPTAAQLTTVNGERGDLVAAVFTVRPRVFGITDTGQKPLLTPQRDAPRARLFLRVQAPGDDRGEPVGFDDVFVADAVEIGSAGGPTDMRGQVR